MRDTLLDDAVKLTPPRGSRRILAVAGPPAAGKSTLARRLVAGVDARLGADAAGYVPLDGFHLSNAQLDRLDVRGRKGAPFTFDVDGYLELLHRLRRDLSSPIYVPDYDRVLHEPIAARHVIWPRTRLVVTEGNYLASRDPGWRDVADVADAVWLVDAPDAVREERLMRRHAGGDRPEAEARERTVGNDRPNGEYVRRSLRPEVRLVDPQDPTP
ncbi:MAG: nucleoside/nucleotide kinase family protein [Stackebrandtia sp.]